MSALVGAADTRRGLGSASVSGEALSAVTLPRLLLLAALLRLAALAVSTPAHADEVFQYLETAHRLVFGRGVITWEWRYGVRGWLLPWLVSLPMSLGAAVAPGSALYRVLPEATMALLSLGVVVFAWRVGEHVSRLHAQVAGFAAAIWCELIYFAPHVLSETASIALILPAALILIDRARWSGWRLAGAAALLSAAASIRFQHLPAIGVLVLATCGSRPRDTWRPLLLGALAGLVPSTLCDLAMGAQPFAWIGQNVRFNIAEGRSNISDVSGPLGYLADAWRHLSGWTIPLALLAAFGARRAPALAWTAAANLAAHSAIAHKEYRYILLTVMIGVVLAAIGAVDVAARLSPGADPAARRRQVSLICLVWVVASVGVAFGGYRDAWTRYGSEMALFDEARTDRTLCGLAIYNLSFADTGGYAYLHRPAPLYYFSNGDFESPQAGLQASAGAFNTVLAKPRDAAQLPEAYSALRCEGRGEDRACLYRRAGACAADAAPAFEINAVLRRMKG